MLRWRSAGSLPELAEVFVSTKRTSSNKPSTCGYGTSTDLVLRITTDPVQLAGQLEGKQVHVGRVALSSARPVVISCQRQPAKLKSIVMWRWRFASFWANCIDPARWNSSTHAAD